MFDNEWGGAQGCTIIEGRLVYGPWVFRHPEFLIKAYPKGAGDGDCAKLAQLPLQMPYTRPYWRRGIRVLGNDGPVYRNGLKVSETGVLRGTVIATFDEEGFYPNTRRKHVAIYLGQGKQAGRPFIKVIDQWLGHPPAERIIHSLPNGYISNNAEAFSVVYTTHPGFQKP